MVTGVSVVIVVATWPSTRYLTTRVYWTLYSEDMGMGLWWPNAFADAVMRGENPFHATSLEWPVGTHPLMWNFGLPLLFFPIYYLARPILATNLVAFAIALLNAFSCAWLARLVTGTRAGAVVGLLVGATNAYAWAEAGAGRQDQAFWAPIALFLGAWLLLLREPERWRYRIVAAASLAAAGACYWFHALFLGVVTAIATLGMALRRNLSRARVRALAVVASLASAMAIPFLLPLLADWSAFVTQHQAVSAQVPALIPQQIAWSLTPACFGGLLTQGRNDPSIHTPLLLLPASLWAAWRGQGDIRLLGRVGLIAALFSAGPILTDWHGQPVKLLGHWVPLPTYYLNAIPGFHRLWWPHRWLAVAFPVHAAAMAALISRAHRKRPLIAAFAILSIAECAIILRINHPPRSQLWPKEHVPEVFDQLADVPYPAPILHLPLEVVAPKYLCWQPFHRQPIDQGADWHIPGLVPEAYHERLHRLPIVQAIEQASHGITVPQHNTWSPEDAGGFHYVLLNLEEVVDNTLLEAVTGLLGAPFYHDSDVVIWNIPGVGRPVPPPGSPRR